MEQRTPLNKKSKQQFLTDSINFINKTKDTNFKYKT